MQSVHSMDRPEVTLIKKAYDQLFNSGLSLSKIRDAALGDRLFPSSSSDSIGVPGRSIAWKIFLAKNEPLQSPSGLGPSYPLESLRKSRKEYTNLLLDKMRAPDGGYEEGFVVPGSSTSPKRVSRSGGNLETNNPLSLHNENPWTEWFTSMELRKTILQDVERTFPDISFFRDPDVQSQLTNVLFLHSTTHPDIGYRQGMHELLAPLYHAVEYDSIQEEIDDSVLREICSRTWVAADAWTLFDSVMTGISRWYEWRDTPTGRQTATASTQKKRLSPLDTHLHINNVPNGPLDLTPYVAPIVQACNHIQSTLLRTVDPLLWTRMQAAGIEPQIYGIRWLRLLFTREFSMHDAMTLWDGLFACDPTFELAQWICVAMLVRIRNELIPADYSGQLTVLLRYPSPPAPSASSLDNTLHHVSILLKQALALQMSPTPSTGASLVIENRNLLNIPIEVPEPPQRTHRQAGHGMRDKSASESRSGADPSGSRSAHHPRQSSQAMGLPESIARGLLERGESLGINKTLMSAVSELRRNIPEFAASIAANVRSPGSSSSSYSFPLEDERPPEERPPWEPRTRFEMERDISELRTRDKRLGESLSWIVDILLQNETELGDPKVAKQLQTKKREAVESLSYIRDVLVSNATEIEEDRLVGEEEMRKRRIETRNEARAAKMELPPPTAPVPVPVTDSRPKPPLKSRSPPPVIPVGSPPVSPSLQSPTRLAPWNYTRSNFSGTTVPTATLPRRPPPTLTSPTVIERKTSPRHDPLGVLR